MHRKLKISILTTSRSDFGLLKNLIFLSSKRFQVDILVGGSHFLKSKGYSYDEINSEFKKNKYINIIKFKAMEKSETVIAQNITISKTQLLASKYFSNSNTRMLIFLGDRWELTGFTIPALLHQIPLSHITGGEITDGSMDNYIRNFHTTISNFHFTANNLFAQNISQRCEEDWRISIVGECGLDLVYKKEYSKFKSIKNQFNIKDKYILITFHPSTLDFKTKINNQIENILISLEQFSKYQLIFTSPGMEFGSKIITKSIEKFIKNNKSSLFVNNFGSKYYLPILKNASLIVGNSSSGLVEAPSFKTPCVNIGDRQKNRPRSKSVINVNYDVKNIINAISQALSKNFKTNLKDLKNPYDPYLDGKNSLRIVNCIDNVLNNLSLSKILTKKFANKVNKKEWNSYI